MKKIISISIFLLFGLVANSALAQNTAEASMKITAKVVSTPSVSVEMYDMKDNMGEKAEEIAKIQLKNIEDGTTIINIPEFIILTGNDNQSSYQMELEKVEEDSSISIKKKMSQLFEENVGSIQGEMLATVEHY